MSEIGANSQSSASIELHTSTHRTSNTMARKRKDLGEVAATQIMQMTQRGDTVACIAKATGIPMATVGRRVKEIKAGAALAPATPETPITEIPPGASAEVLEDLLTHARQGLQKAVDKSDLAAMGTMGRLIAQITDQQRKREPLPTQDPNDRPDTKALAKQVAIRMRELCKQVTG